jgi:hypothetical protein
MTDPLDDGLDIDTGEEEEETLEEPDDFTGASTDDR